MITVDIAAGINIRMIVAIGIMIMVMVITLVIMHGGDDDGVGDDGVDDEGDDQLSRCKIDTPLGSGAQAGLKRPKLNKAKETRASFAFFS